MALTFLLRRLSFTADFLQTTGEKLSRALPRSYPIYGSSPFHQVLRMGKNIRQLIFLVMMVFVDSTL